MADPLSTAGTAVGIVSLGIQVSQGLITYYSHFKAHDEEIAYLVRKSKSLQGLLQALDGPLKKAESGNGDISVQVRNAVTACEAGLNRLSTAAEKYGNMAIPVNREDKLRALKKRALYPFKRTTLQDLSLTLEQLLSNMQLALQILTLDISQSHKDTTIYLSETTSRVALQSIARYDARSDKLENMLDQLVLHRAHFQFLINGIADFWITNRTVTFTSPSGASVTGIHVSAAGEASKCFKHVFPHKKPQSEDFCPGRKPDVHLPSASTSYQKSLSAIWSVKFLEPDHTASSPMSTFTVLGYSIAATFSIARGAGGFAISPHFMVRAVVPRDSPAFQLLGTASMRQDFRVKFPSPVDHANFILRQLHLLFEDNKASPRDVNPRGETLLHVSNVQILSEKSSDFEKSVFGLICTWCRNYTKSSSQITQAAGNLLDGLLDFGAEPFERDSYGDTLLNFALAELSDENEPALLESDQVNILCKLVRRGLTIEGTGTSWSLVESTTLVHKTLKSLTQEEIFGTLEVPDTLQAIYLQDEIALEEAIACSPKSVEQIYQYGQTPLHTSASWPQGLSVLLAHGAETSIWDINGYTPLFHACYIDQVASVSLLLDHDSPLGARENQNACLGYVCSMEDLSVIERFNFHLVNRRQRLLKLALDKLPTLELEMLDLKEDRVLDARAAAVTSALLRRGVSVEPALMPSGKPRRMTVYHTTSLSIQMADSLLEAGFKDIDEIDAQRWTPFWSHIFKLQHDFGRIEILQWLKDNGADVYRKDSNGGGTAMHALGAAIGQKHCYLKHGSERWRFPILQQSKIAASFLADDATDSCQCACSKSGCRIITSALKMPRDWYYWHRQPTREKHWSDYCLRICHSILQLVESYIAENPWMPFEVIRVMTFEWLKLTHTCHVDPKDKWDRSRGPLSDEEIQEIHHEERYLLQEHEELVTEFETNFTELGLPLTIFLKEHWKPKMAEILLSHKKCDVEEERRKMRELGVMVVEPNRVEELDDDDYDEKKEVAEEENVEDGENHAGDEPGSEVFHDCEEIPGSH